MFFPGERPGAAIVVVCLVYIQEKKKKRLGSLKKEDLHRMGSLS